MNRRLFDGDTFEHAGHSFRVSFAPDDYPRSPWDDCGRGIVSDWRTVERWTGRSTKRAGERILCTERGSARFFDFAATMDKARRDGWGLAPDDLAKLRAKLGREPTRGQILAAAVEHEYEFLRAWCSGDWEYVIVDVVMLDSAGEETEYRDSVGGVDSWRDYHVTVALECAENCIHERREDIKRKAKETRERRYWAARGVETRP